MDFLKKLFSWFSHISWGEDDDDCATVKVKSGDSLWVLAEDLTGDGNRWHELVDANPDRTFDQDYALQVGEELRIPKNWVLI